MPLVRYIRNPALQLMHGTHVLHEADVVPNRLRTKTYRIVSHRLDTALREALPYKSGTRPTANMAPI